MSHAGPVPELESLRSQVAELARALAEQDRSLRAQHQQLELTMQDLQEQSHLLRTIMEGTAAETGDEFFASLVTHLTAALAVEYAVVAELVGGDRATVRTLAVSARGTLEDNFEYSLQHAPCATALERPFWCFEQDVQTLFPHFPNLASLGVESHCGVSLRTKTGAVIGLLIVMDTKPLRNSSGLRSLMQVFASRATAELQRHRAERAQHDTERQLRFTQFAVDHAVDAVFWTDTSKRFLYANETARRWLGYTTDELLALTIPDIAPGHDAERFQERLLEMKRGIAATYESRLRRKDGTEFPIEVSVNYVEHEGQGYICGLARDISERRRAQEALEREERHLVAAQALAHLGSWEWDLETDHVSWSDEQIRIFGYDPEALVVTPDTWLTALHPDDHDRVLAALNEALIGRGPFDDEFRIVRPTGEVRVIRGRGEMHRDTAGRPRTMEGTVLDVTEQKQAEEALRLSEERWQLAVRGSNDGIWDWNVRTGAVFFSSRWKRMRGYADDEIADSLDEWRSRIHPDDMERVLKAVDAYCAKQQPDFCEEYRVQRKDGSYIWVLDRGIALWDTDGKPVRMAGSETDITERVRQEEALRESEARTRSIIETALDAVVSIDRDGLVIGWNSQAETIFGYPAHETMGRKLSELIIPPQYRAAHDAGIERVFQTAGGTLVKRRIESPALHRDGHEFPVEFAMTLTQVAGHPVFTAFIRDITEQKQAEGALRESEERYRMLIDLSPSGIFVYSEGKTVYVNRAACRILGADSPEQILDRPALNFVHPDCHAAILESARLLMEGGDPVRRAESKYLKLDGTVIQVEVEAAPILWKGHRAIQGIFSDITDRKKAEETLHRTTSILSALIRSSPVAIITSDTEGRLSSWNPAAERMFGWTEAEVLGGQAPYIAPENQEKAEALWNLALTGGNTQELELRRHRKNGEQIDIEFWGGALRDRQGLIAGAFGVMADITERKRAEEALRASEERFRTTFEKAAVGMYLCDLDGRIRQVNPALCRILGYDEAELLQLDFQSITHPDDLQANRPRVTQLIEGTISSLFIEKRHLRKDGGFIWAQASVSVLHDHAGRPSQLLAMVQDITERKRAEEALQRSERQLRTVLDSLPIGVWFTDAQGQVLYGNPVGQKLWSHATRVGLPEQRSGRLWWETVEGAQLPHRWAIGTVMSKGEPILNETIELETKASNRITVRNSAVPVRGDDGIILSAIVLNEDITERVRAEEALRQQHSLLTAIMNAATDIIFVKDRKGRYLHMNPAGARALGMSVEEVLGWSDYAVWPLDLAASCRAADRKVLETGETVTVEEVSTLGEKRTVYLTTKAPYREASGAIIGIIGVSRDITERKQAEEALRASEERFSKAFRSSPHPVVIADLESGLIIEANDAAYHLFGYGPTDIEGRTSLEIGLWPSPDDRARFIAELKQQDSVKNREVRLRMKNGEMRRCLLSSELIDLHGRRCMVTVGNDITEQQRAQEELRQSHAFIRQIIDIDPNFIFAKDREGRFTLVNKAVADAYGTTVENLIGKTDADFNANSAEVACFRRQDLEVIDSLQERFIAEEVMTDVTGTQRWLQTVKRPIVNGEGVATMVLAASTDITERKRMEEALRQRELDLRHAIEERERISQDLHDGILQSLYAVGLGLESCKPLIKQRKHKQAFTTLEQAVGQLNHVMREVRNFIAGLESEVLQGGNFDTALRTVINAATQAYPVECRIHIEPEALPYIPLDRGLQLLNIVREALSNIVRHAGASQMSVSVRRLRRTIRIRIHDNGVGFDLQTAAGTGHGLLNMAARAKKIGTDFELHSAPGEGTTIIVDLPKEEGYAEREGETHSSVARGRP